MGMLIPNYDDQIIIKNLSTAFEYGETIGIGKIRQKQKDEGTEFFTGNTHKLEDVSAALEIDPQGNADLTRRWHRFLKLIDNEAKKEIKKALHQALKDEEHCRQVFFDATHRPGIPRHTLETREDPVLGTVKHDLYLLLLCPIEATQMQEPPAKKRRKKPAPKLGKPKSAKKAPKKSAKKSAKKSVKKSARKPVKKTTRKSSAKRVAKKTIKKTVKKAVKKPAARRKGGKTKRR